MQTFFTSWTQGGPSVAYTPGGLALAGNEGRLRSAANAALLALVHARHSSGFGSVRLACWARGQVFSAHPFCDIMLPLAKVAPLSMLVQIQAPNESVVAGPCSASQVCTARQSIGSSMHASVCHRCSTFWDQGAAATW